MGSSPTIPTRIKMETLEILKRSGFEPRRIYQDEMYIGPFVYRLKTQCFVDTRTGVKKKGLYTMIYLLKREVE